MISNEDAVIAIKEKTGFVDHVQPENCGSCRHMEINLSQEQVCTLNDTFQFEVNNWSKCSRFTHKP